MDRNFSKISNIQQGGDNQKGKIRKREKDF